MQGYEDLFDGHRDQMGNLGGIMPRAFDYIFKVIHNKEERFQLKAS